jgi:hypothetical protein
MLSGILADSAGWQSINAGNVGDGVVNELKSGYDNMKSVASLITGSPKQPGGVAAGGAAAGGGGASGDGGGQPENKGSSGEKDSIKPDGLMGMTAQAAKKGMENIKSETGESPQQNMGGTGSGDEGSQDTGLQQSNQAGMGDTKDESGLGGKNNNADMGNLNNGTGGPGSNGGNTQTNQSNISQTADKNGGNTNNENQASINQTSVNQNNLNQANNNDVNATGNDSVNYGQQMSTDTAQNNTIAQGLGDVSAQQNNVSSMANGLNVDQANMATGNIPNVGGGLNLDTVKTPPNIINYGNK